MGALRRPRVALSWAAWEIGIAARRVTWALGCLGLATSTPAVASTLTTLVPTDDTYIRGGGSEGQYFDADPMLRVKNSSGEDNDRETLLRFDLSGVRGRVVAATLRLHCQALTNGAPAAACVHSVTDDGWQEDTATWNTAPPAAALLASRTDIETTGQAYEFDVTAFVVQELGADGVVSFRLRDDVEVKKAVDFDSREGATPPALVVETIEEASISVQVYGSGQVTLSPPGGTYPLETLVTLMAVPDPGWQLDVWGGVASGTANPQTVTLTEDTSVWVNFVPIPQVPLTLHVYGQGSVALAPPGGTYPIGNVVRLTPAPAPGWSFAGWGEDLAGNANPDSLVIDAAKTVSATFTTNAPRLGTIALAQIASGADSNTAMVKTSASLHGVDGDLYLAAIASRPFQPVVAVLGLGLAWARVQEQCSGSGEAGVTLWMAQGDASSGRATATLTDSTTNIVLTVCRYTAVAMSQPLGIVIAANTTGANGACSGGTAAASYSLGPSTPSANGIVFGAIAHPDRIHSPGSGWTERAEVHWGAPGSGAALATVDRPLDGGTLLFEGTFDDAADWAAVAVEIRPLPLKLLSLSTTGLGSAALDPPGGIYTPGALVALQALPAPGCSFVGWGADLSGSSNPMSVVMSNDLSIAATFSSVLHFDLRLEVQGAGNVVVEPPGRRYAAGSSVALTATPFPGWIFTGWGGDSSGSQQENTLTMSADRTVSAHFRYTGGRVSGLWTSAAELAAAPMQGGAWDRLLEAANLPFFPPNVADQDSPDNVNCLAAAIVFARTGNTTYRDRVIAALDTLATLGNPGANTLAWARELGAYALAADLVGYRTAAFDAWLRQMAEVYVGTDVRTLQATFRTRPNNWGMHAFGALVSVYAYLHDDAQLRAVRDYWVQGVTGVPSQSSWGELWWHFDPARPRLINPPRAAKQGLDIDGVIADDMRRGGPPGAPPIYTGYPWEAMQGIVMAARVLERYDPELAIWHVEENAIQRAARLLQVRWEQQFGGWAAKSNDAWMLPFLDAAYGTHWSTGNTHEFKAGKNVGWAYVLLGNSGIAPPTDAPEDTPPDQGGRSTYKLYPGLPNPFTRGTSIRFNLPSAIPVRLVVYDVAGRRVATLHDGQLPAGLHTLRWDGADTAHTPVASGVYWCVLQAGSRRDSIRLTRVR